MTEYYNDKYAEGTMYQDFVIDQLRKYDPCIIVQTYSSRQWQYEHGESASGVEIKYDKKFEEGSPNLYIEVAEKSDAALENFTPSGIFRNDNSWLYLIGSYSEAFLFSKRQLQSVYASKNSWQKRGIFEVEIDTSKGFCYPAVSAISNGTCLYHYVFDEKKAKCK